MSTRLVERNGWDREVPEESGRGNSLEPFDITQPLTALVFEYLPAVVFVKDADGLRYRLFNRAGEELVGCSRNDVLAKTDHELFPREAASYQEKDREALANGTIVDIPQEPLQTRNGPRIVETKKVPIFGPDGKPLYILGLSQDITERTRHERERSLLLDRLDCAIRARDDLIALVSHDLKNPMTTILMAIHCLAGGTASNPSGTLARIGHAATRVTRLIDQLVDAAAIEAGQFRIAPREEVVVEPLIDEAIESLSALAAERNQRIEPCLIDPFCRLCCDRDLILQVLANLIGNAVKFTPSGGRIIVSAHGENEGVRFSVADTGPGIPVDQMDHLFDRYWQARHAGRASAGLGLYIVKGIVEAHGGTVWAENLPGGGSRFSFRLPRYAPAPPPA